jgi:tRNA/rRNA methyltransferase
LDTQINSVDLAAQPVDALQRVRVVLVHPSHPGNVGSVARAMRVMGLQRLILVAPRQADALRDPQAIAFAAGADSVLQHAQIVDFLPQALADCSLSIAISAGDREFGPPPLTPEDAALQVLDHGGEVALVFGPERSGLTVEQVGFCQRLCSIPTAGPYSSLNLAQAVQVIAYVLRRSVGAVGADRSGTATVPARHEDIEGFLAHWQRALVAIGYLDPAHPKKLMPRMRRLFARAGLQSEEVQLLRGVCKLMEQTAAKADSNH